MCSSLRRFLTMAMLPTALSACSGERPDNLGVRSGLLALCPSSPNCVASQSGTGRQRVLPLVCRSEPDADFSRLKTLLSRRKDTKIIEESDGYLRVEFHTTFFVDDGEFLLDREQRLIHLRSASRIGHSDLGKNRCRIEEIRLDFHKGEK